MKKLLLCAIILSSSGNMISQTWQPMGIPEGSGVTDLVYWSGGGAVFGDKLWATTGSVNWPTGQRGGVFYSATSGTYQGIWYRIGGSAGYYVGRTLAVGQDGNLYASLWRDPATFPADALCRFAPQAATFGLLYQAQAGDNIFSIAVKNNPHTIFAGTRNGIIRSIDNGTTFGYSNTGIPDSAWVYDIAIDSSGILAIASSKGVFISSDNGDNWLATTGISTEDTTTTILFVDDTSSINKTTSKTQDKGKLVIGAEYKIFVCQQQEQYLNASLMFTMIEQRRIEDLDRAATEIYMGYRYVGDYSSGGVLKSSDYQNWNEVNNGLPNDPVSALTTQRIDFFTNNGLSYKLYAGLFNDTTNGAGIYRLDITVGVDETNDQIPTEFILEQNYPNPFNPSTIIQFSIPEQSFVKLEVFNSLGEKISTLVTEELNVGNYKYEWNGENLSSGIYYYKLSTIDFVQTKKLVLLK